MSLLSLTDIDVVSIILVILYKIAIDTFKYYICTDDAKRKKRN